MSFFSATIIPLDRLNNRVFISVKFKEKTMKKNWMKIAACAGILVLMAMPMAVKADSVSVSFNINADDQAHFDFKAGRRHYHPMIWKAAQQLQAAKHTLYGAADDFNGHKMDAISAINGALDQLRICAQK
jgi:hypothetical protein